MCLELLYKEKINKVTSQRVDEYSSESRRDVGRGQRDLLEHERERERHNFGRKMTYKRRSSVRAPIPEGKVPEIPVLWSFL